MLCVLGCVIYVVLCVLGYVMRVVLYMCVGLGYAICVIYVVLCVLGYICVGLPYRRVRHNDITYNIIKYDDHICVCISNHNYRYNIEHVYNYK